MYALNANRAAFGAVYLSHGFTALGEVNLVTVRIETNLQCNSGRFENPGGLSLNASIAAIGGGVSRKRVLR